MIAKQIIAFAIGLLSTAVLGLLTLPFAAWFLPPDDIGRLSMLQVVTGFAIFLFSLGLDQAYVREFHLSNRQASVVKGGSFARLCFAHVTTRHEYN